VQCVYIYIFYICTFQGSCARFRDVVHVSEMLCKCPRTKCSFIQATLMVTVWQIMSCTWQTPHGSGPVSVGGYHGKPSRLQTKPYKQDMRQLHKRFHYISIGSPSINNDKQTSKPHWHNHNIHCDNWFSKINDDYTILYNIRIVITTINFITITTTISIIQCAWIFIGSTHWVMTMVLCCLIPGQICPIPDALPRSAVQDSTRCTWRSSPRRWNDSPCWAASPTPAKRMVRTGENGRFF
jgi:hypothetical protein